jgi:tryptophan synthase beta chain
MYSYLLQDEVGQISEAHSISAGLDYPGVGPEHAHLAASGRARYDFATDEEVLAAFRMLAETEGIIPALEPAHALAWVVRNAGTTIPEGACVLVTLSGRGDKDVAQVRDILRGPAGQLGDGQAGQSGEVRSVRPAEQEPAPRAEQER